MNIRIAIVDDQAQTRELLRQDLLVRVPDGASIACFDGGEAFLSGFTPGDDALVFLDICMEGMNGIEVAQRVRKRSARCLIVFLTSSKEYAFDAFPIHPFDYLVKPYSAARLDHVLSGAIRLMEESEQIEAEDVISYTEKLRSTLPQDVTVSYLHGKMKPAKKNEIMEAFVKNEIQVLVSTTVIEVGVNVPNASVMMIENAERFGLAQLHQLRGRVGRGDAQSYCILCYGKDGEKTKKRLEILNKSNDGFYIANEDLRLRGPGDLFGIRQSGELAFRIGDVFQDAAILQEANDAANDTLQDPSYPEGKDYAILRQNLEKYMYKDLCNLNL